MNLMEPIIQREHYIEDLRRKNARLRAALKLYANLENWSFYHTTEGYIRWVTKLGPDEAIEALMPEAGEESPISPGDGTLRIKKQ